MHIISVYIYAVQRVSGVLKGLSLRWLNVVAKSRSLKFQSYLDSLAERTGWERKGRICGCVVEEVI